MFYKSTLPYPEIKVEKENIKNSSERYATSFVFNGAYYQLIGSMEEADFLKIVTRLMP